MSGTELSGYGIVGSCLVGCLFSDGVWGRRAERVRGVYSEEVKALAIHTDVFDGVLRFVAAILDADGVLAAEEFWGLVRATVDEYAEDHPEHAATAARYDLARPEFRRTCLNRLQLRNTLQMVDLAEPAESLIFAGTLRNPIADVST